MIAGETAGDGTITEALLTGGESNGGIAEGIILETRLGAG